MRNSLVIRRNILAVLAVSVTQSASVWCQTTPNWGTGSTTSAPSGSGSTSAWGGIRTPMPEAPQGTTTHFRGDHTPPKGSAVPPALAAVLQRPDTDTIALPNGERATVAEIRAEANSRQAVITALKTGSVPAGRKRVVLGTARAPKYQELLSASASVKDAARREAAAQWISPSVIPETPDEHRDRPNAWGASVETTEAHSTYPTAGRFPGSDTSTVLHSGIGNSQMSNSGYAARRATNTSSTVVSRQPDQAYLAQNLPSGIGAVNGHSNPQFTPGGLYTLTGKGFGDAVGSVDLIGTHLPSGRIALPVTQWQDGKVQVQFPEPVSGVPDGPVTLRLTTHAGALLTKQVQFYATRQQLTLTGPDLDVSQLFDISLGNQTDWNQTTTTSDQILRTKSGNNINCPSIGQDSLRTRFPAGWMLAEVTVSTWLPTQGNPNKDFFGNDGDTVVSGNYTITQVPAGFTNQLFNANWGVLRSHSTNGFRLVPQFTGNDFGWSGNDGCVSAYSLSVILVGPAGLRPY